MVMVCLQVISAHQRILSLGPNIHTSDVGLQVLPFIDNSFKRFSCYAMFSSSIYLLLKLMNLFLSYFFLIFIFRYLS